MDISLIYYYDISMLNFYKARGLRSSTFKLKTSYLWVIMHYALCSMDERELERHMRWIHDGLGRIGHLPVDAKSDSEMDGMII